MDSIKKKMMAMKLEKENALEKAINLENQLKEKAKDFEKKEEEMNDWLSKVKNIQTEVDTVQESLQEAISKLEETEKRATNAEAEVAAMTRRIRLLEEDFEQSSGRLTETSTKLDDASKAAEESERNRKTLETRSISDDERMAQLEEQAARRLAVTEVDLERAESRLETSESKIVELEEELRIVGNNMKSLEVSEQESLQREESYEETIRDLTERLKTAEQRAAEAERQVSKLQNEVDRLEDELLSEKERYRAISGELDTTFAELTSF
uniref:Tropomyosin n=1 Tax=Echinococcus granulosus TaxID=6210 RepID=A0A068WGS3_ECHGR|nr:tropomyosin [Echinococcus granulosus]